MLLFVLAMLVQAPPTLPATCATATECREQCRQAISAGDFERAHDLAWLAFQKGSKQDPGTLTLLARAQSLSGRADDAYIMLRRLVDLNVMVEDVREGKDFERVRAHANWPELLAAYETLAARADTRVVDADDSDVIKPPAEAAREAPAPATPPKPSAAATPAVVGPPVAKAKPAPDFEISRAGDDLGVPEPFRQPVAMAYDAVSARFVLSSAATDELTVLSQTSTNVASFTSRGWSGRESTTALAIDRVAGDLWVAVNGALGSMLHRLQLISGRRLDAIELPGQPDAEVIALALAPDGVYALDRAGRRVLRRAAAAKTVEVFSTLPPELTATGMTRSPNAVYVAHTDGLLRIDGTSRRPRPLTSEEEPLSGLHSLAWHEGMLFAVRRVGDERQVVRLRVNAAGSAVTRVDVLGRAAALAATLSNGVYYYLTDDATAGSVTLRGVTVK
jgi:hypothetical protein